MRIFIAFVAALTVVAAGQAKTLAEDFPEVGLDKKIPLQASALRESKEFFTHSRELLMALGAKESSFTVKETVHPAEKTRNLAEYLEKNPAGNEYDTKSVYTLTEGSFVSLDDAPFASSIRDLSASTLAHCGAEASAEVFVPGRILIGSSEGAWYASEHVQSRLLTAGLLPKHETKPTLTLVRRVLSAEANAADKCVHVKTEPLGALEIFNEIHIESLGSHPFSTTFYSEPGSERDLQGTMGYGNVKADPPLISCQASYWQNNVTPYTIGKGKNYALGLTIGCAQWDTLTPGFNMNYNTQTHSAVQSNIDLSNGMGSGMTCSNCYAFMGNAFLAIINYKLKGMSLSFEVKLNGGAGLNLAVNMNNPSIRSAWSKWLLNPQTTFKTISLGSSLSLQYKLGGVYAEVTGSGSAAGIALMQGGATGDLQMGALYDGSKMTAASNNFASFVKVRLSFAKYSPIHAPS